MSESISLFLLLYSKVISIKNIFILKEISISNEVYYNQMWNTLIPEKHTTIKQTHFNYSHKCYVIIKIPVFKNYKIKFVKWNIKELKLKIIN